MTDALTEILGSVHMRGSIFSRASLAAPWGVESGDLGSGIFHAVVRGRAIAQLADGGPVVTLERGDVVMMPFGDNHLMTDEPGRPSRLIGDLTTMDEKGMGQLAVTGDGAITSLICGTVSFDRGAAHPLFSMLPRMIHVRDADGAMARVVETLIGLIAEEVDGGAPGSPTVVARLTDVLIIYVLRDYIERLPEGEVGWLGALRDPEIRSAIGLMHARPAEAWTAERLAAAVGMSRSALFERFKETVGDSPSQYLTRWRVHLATRMLAKDRVSVGEVAQMVGYGTEAGFSNAFTRLMGIRPGAYKRMA